MAASGSTGEGDEMSGKIETAPIAKADREAGDGSMVREARSSRWFAVAVFLDLLVFAAIVWALWSLFAPP